MDPVVPSPARSDRSGPRIPPSSQGAPVQPCHLEIGWPRSDKAAWRSSVRRAVGIGRFRRAGRLLSAAFLGLAVTASAARATAVAAGVNDLVLGFRATAGVGAGSNLEINLGSASPFATATGTVTLSRLVAADLAAVYGASWNTRLGTDLFWGVVGTTGRTAGGPNGQAVSTLWATAIQDGAGASTPWARKVGTLQNNGAVKIEGLYAGAAASLDGSTALPSNAYSAKVDSSTTGSWTIQRGATASAFAFFTPNTQFDSPAPIVPSITTQPAALAVNAGAAASFTVAVSPGNNFAKADLYQIQPGSGAGSLLGTFVLSGAGGLTFVPPPATAAPSTLTYQWRKNGTAIAAATSATYTIAGTQTGDVASYSVTVTSATGTVTSDGAALTVNSSGAPAIVTQPTAQTVAAGATATFTVVGSGTPVPTYQWTKNSTAVPGGTNATLSLSGAQSTDAGTYAVTLTNANGSVTSDAVTLTVTASGAPGTPTITTQPVTQTVPVGSSVSFSVVADATPAPVYQWNKDGSPISGATNATYAIAGAQTADAGNYTVAVSNASGAVTSNPATLTVGAPGSAGAPTITTQPVAPAIALGASVTFVVIAQGTPAPSYQWKKNGVAIPGANQAGYTIGATQAADAGVYTVTVSNTAGSVTSNAAAFSFASGPRIVTPPAAQTAKVGSSVTFTVIASGSPAPFYQWNKDGVPIAGATNSTLALASVRTSDAGSYTVIAANSAGALASGPAVLTVNPPDFSGTYFVSFGPGRGTAALYVRPDNSAVFVAYLLQSRSAIATNFAVGPDGRFVAAGSEVRASGAAVPLAAATEPNQERPLDEARGFALSGQIAGSAVSGRLVGLDENFSGPAEASLGPTQSLAGYYSAGALGTGAGRTYVVVGASGLALVVTASPNAVDGAVASVTAFGQLKATTAAGGEISGQLNLQTKTLAAALVPAGSTTTLSFAGLLDSLVPSSRLRNLSTRGFVAAGGNLTPGFVMKGAGSKQIVIRAVGSALAQFPGISAPLADPKMELIFPLSGGISTVANDDWGGSAALAAAFASVGAFPLPPNSKDAALSVTLANSSTGYTINVAASRAGASGTALVEIYDADPINAPVRLVNVSTLGFAGRGEQALAAGFVIDGNVAKLVLIRAVGPGLSQFPGQSDLLADPQLQVIPSGQPYFVAASNNDWGGTPALKTAFAQAGAFALPDTSRDAAVLVTLQPGAYTVAVSGAGTSTGTVLVEIYDLDP